MNRTTTIFIFLILLCSLTSAQIIQKEPVDVFKDKSTLSINEDIVATKIVDKRVYDFESDYSTIRIASSKDINFPKEDTFDVAEKGFITYSFPEGYVVKEGHLICDESSYRKIGTGFGATHIWDMCINYTPQWKKYLAYNKDTDEFVIDKYNVQNFTKVSDTQITVHHAKNLDPSVTDYQTNMLLCWGFDDVATDSAGNYDGGLYSGAIFNTTDGYFGSALQIERITGDYFKSNSSISETLNSWTLMYRVYNVESQDRPSTGKSNDDFLKGNYKGAESAWDASGDDCDIYDFATNDLSLNTWYTITHTFDPSVYTQCQIYTNTLNDATDTAYSGTTTLNTLYVGDLGAGTFGMSGMIDEFMVWNYELTSANVSYIVNNNISCSDIWGGGCSPDIVNTSWSAWANWTDGTCNYTQNRSATRYDANDCGAANVTIWQNQTLNDSSGYNDCGAGCARCNGAGSCADDNSQCSAYNCSTGTCTADACTVYSSNEKALCEDCYQCSNGDVDCDLININTDPHNDCPSVQCDSGAGTPYYWGWAALTCYYRNDTQGFCDGSGACKSQAVECSGSGQDGSSGVVASCVDAQENCTATFIGVDNASACSNCTETWVWSAYANDINITGCALNNSMNWTQNRTYTDCNSTLHVQYNNYSQACNYCTMQVNCSGYGSCINSTQAQTCSDDNYSTCCGLTGLVSDCYRRDNLTFNTTYTLNISCSNATSGTTVIMMSIGGDNKMLGLVIGILGIAGLLLWFSKSLDKSHNLLKLFMVLCFFSVLILIPKTTLDSQCQTVVNTTTVISATETEYSYKEFCTGSSPNNTSVIFNNIFLWIYRVFWIYVGVYFMYMALTWLGLSPFKNKKIKFNEQIK